MRKQEQKKGRETFHRKERGNERRGEEIERQGASFSKPKGLAARKGGG